MLAVMHMQRTAFLNNGCHKGEQDIKNINSLHTPGIQESWYNQP